MFDFVRNHTRLVLGIMVLLIFPSFIFFGIQGYSRFVDGTNDTVAKVNGQSITRAEWDAAHQRAVDRLRAQNPKLDAKLLDSPQAKRQTLEQMVRERVLLAAANDLHLWPDDDRLQRLFVNDPQFAGLRNPNGSVNDQLLAAQGMNSQMLAQQLRQEFGMRQVMSGITDTAFASTAAAAPALDAMLQRRELQYQRFDPASYRAQIDPSDADVEAYYKAHLDAFKAPEQAKIDYVVLDLAALTKGVTIPEEDLRRYYDENANLYTDAEQRRASHILVKVDPDASAAAKQAAKKHAEDLLAELRKNPGSFAELAKKESQDPGSAAQGGDLGYFGRGTMTKPFENAVFAMKVGDISDIVTTDFGYHIIELTGIRGGTKKPFDAVRADVEAAVRKQIAQKKFADAAEQFTNMVYEQSDSLQPAIDKFKLDKQSATVTRTPAPGATGALASAKLLNAIFANDVLRNKHNTDAVEVGPDQLASARVVQYLPEHVMAFAEVKDQARARLVADLAAARAKSDGEQRLAALRKDPAGTL
ncbi:MAG: SurA N-terminal domain-containing protein, partial [Burkholderiales bacterium]|nr:SurA N-terminal domain-containing protein [Burkholderiales bacterium]